MASTLRGARKLHYWIAIISAVPMIIIGVTGILLMLKKDVAWVQPPTQKAAIPTDYRAWQPILDATAEAVATPNLTWKDVDRIDFRPQKGLYKVQLESNWEVQIAAENYQIMSVEFRRSGIIEAIHDGSFFTDLIKYGVFLPTSVLVVALWITGSIMFTLMERAKARSRSRRARAKVRMSRNH